jgi:alpha-beta hydrolase superfamily lysophospholipase
VKQSLANDYDAQRLYDIQLARTAPTDAGLTQLTNMYMQRASRAIRQLAPALLKEAGAAAVTQNAQQHEALSASAKAGQAPNSGGKPVQQSIAPNPKQYASMGEKFDDLLADTLGAGSRRR